ncbi:MAG: pantoate--beta-alanine ligase [Verrucomicrobiota bacterium]|nr:pantoate--beta-alanine ligase [Verrucomicrobiota bacterium]
MRIIETVADAHALIASRKRRCVLVPTMGALHRGHLELIRMARAAAGADGEVTVSIFVNPLQFEPGADYGKYPRPEREDEAMCTDADVDILFRPTPAEMYASDNSVTVEETSLSQRLCGRSRPGHFKGVCTVVTKLFHLLDPAAAVFGEKDFQQLAIIRRMVRDLNFPIEVIAAPIVRETDGLACSSRNRYLDAEERRQAPRLREALSAAARLARGGEKSASRLCTLVREMLTAADSARVDYVELVNAETLETRPVVEQNSLLAAAVFFGQTRLIDNIQLE